MRILLYHQAATTLRERTYVLQVLCTESFRGYDLDVFATVGESTFLVTSASVNHASVTTAAALATRLLIRLTPTRHAVTLGIPRLTDAEAKAVHHVVALTIGP